MITEKKEIKTISGRGKKIIYEKVDNDWDIEWGKVKFTVSYVEMMNIIEFFFVDRDKWYSLGSSMTNPIKGGLGEYVMLNLSKLSSRHATAIAAIMYNENMISVKGNRPILLKKSHIFSRSS